ncbi:MAG: bifunctional sugar-1-phosphate nucleotidylyltransferase/acetyltransferase [Candidatus Thermoplasmatota archaeon]|nr:bifunctional sugar-1-phosphate nucleotidylyltransferase/acetyltransferase [Candidatus Thermoplasmatota archaeon]
MKALVLAAGQGARMGPLTENRPKPMLPVAGKPFLEHSINALKEAGVKEIRILTGYHGITIKDHFGNGEKFGVNIKYILQPKRLGTAHAVSMVSEQMDGPFLCLNGDVIVSSDLIKGMISLFEKNGKSLMTLVQVEDPSRFGLVQVEEEKVLGITEKSGIAHPGLINGGIYLFTPGIFNAIKETPLSPRGEYEITRSIEILMESEDVMAYVPEYKWVDIGSPWDLLNAHEIYMDKLISRVDGTVEDGVIIKGDVIIEKGALVKSGTYMEGKVYIDSDAVVGPNSYIRGSTYIGKGSRVGAASEVKNSIVMERSNIPHHNYVGDSIIGTDCNLGSGTKVANLRLDDRNIPVTIKGQRVDSGRRKLGVMIGDNVKTGINATLDPGTIIYSGAMIGPGARASGTIGKDSRIH